MTEPELKLTIATPRFGSVIFEPFQYSYDPAGLNRLIYKRVGTYGNHTDLIAVFLWQSDCNPSLLVGKFAR